MLTSSGCSPISKSVNCRAQEQKALYDALDMCSKVNDCSMSIGAGVFYNEYKATCNE